MHFAGPRTACTDFKSGQVLLLQPITDTSVCDTCWNFYRLAFRGLRFVFHCSLNVNLNLRISRLRCSSCAGMKAQCVAKAPRCASQAQGLFQTGARICVETCVRGGRVLFNDLRNRSVCDCWRRAEARCSACTVNGEWRTDGQGGRLVACCT